MPRESEGSLQTDDEGRTYGLRLLDGFDVECEGRSIGMPPAEQRLVAYLAVRPRACERQQVAYVLFGDRTDERAEDRAAACLRSTVHRIHRRAPDLLDVTRQRLRISPSASIDVRRVDLAIDRILHPSGGLRPDDPELSVLTAEFLPGWYDDWVQVERERLRHRSLHALDAIADHAMRQGRYPRAIEIAFESIALEPLRETPRRIVVECHMFEGNVSEAIREYTTYAQLLRREIGLEPTGRLSGLLPAAR
jgi:DNA-binding SARP family transcriptional activator